MGGTFFIFMVAVIGGLFIRDLGVIFEIMAALSKTSINFIWPGLFYLIAEHRYADKNT